MSENKTLPTPFFNKLILWCLIGIAVITFIIYFYFYFSGYFLGDDFPYLIESSGSLRNLFSPQSNVHFRPVERLHLSLTNVFGFQPVFFNLLSLLLHVFAAFTMYLALKEIYNKNIALFSALLFFIIFSYNETLYWIAQAQVIYCLIFAFLAIYYHKKGKIIPALLFVILSSFSYSLWVILPVYFLFAGRKKMMFFLSLFVVGLHVLIMMFFALPIQYYGPLKNIEELPLRVMYCLAKTIFPFSRLEVGIPILLFFLLVVGVSLYFFIKKTKFSLPFLVFYFVPAGIYLLSTHIPARFFYFPAVAIAIVLTLSFLSVKKPYNYIGGILILYVAVMSPFINYYDGVDYNNYSHEFKRVIMEEGDKLRDLQTGDKVVLINRFPESIPQKYISENLLVGRLKLLFNRQKAISGLIYPKDLVNYVLLERKLKGVPINDRAGAKRISMGNRGVVSEYCFIVAER
jgi:hypothetical protein